MVQIYNPNEDFYRTQQVNQQRNNAIEEARRYDIEQNNRMLQNRQQQDQQNFENQGVLRTRNLEDQAREAANTGDINAIRYLQSLDQEQSQQGSMTGPDGKPATLRAGETPITSGFSSGVSPAEIPNTGTSQPQMTLERLAKSVAKQNPELVNNPTAFFATLDRLKPMLLDNDQIRLEQMKFQHEKELQTQKDTAALERVKARPASGGAGIESRIIEQAMLPVDEGGQGLSFEQAVEQAKAYKRANPEEAGATATAKLRAKNDVGREAGLTKAQSALAGFKQQSQLVTNTIDDALSKINNFSTGFPGAITGSLPIESDARALNNDLYTIKSNIGFDKLQTMRENSPTGGALGQVSDFENKLLQAVNGALDPIQRSQLVKNLNIIKQLYPQVLAEKERAFNQDYGSAQQRLGTTNQQQAPMQGARQAPDGKFYLPDPQRPGKYLQVQ